MDLQSGYLHMAAGVKLKYLRTPGQEGGCIYMERIA